MRALAAPIPCTPPDVDLNNPTPVHFSDQQLAMMREAYGSPEVRGLRAALDSYLADDGELRTAAALRDARRDVLRSRFIVLSDDHNPFGGYVLDVRFNAEPAAIYRAWIYPLAGGPFEIRSWERGVCTAAQQNWLRIRYRDLPKVGG